MPVIETHNLTKIYTGTAAVDNLTLQIEEGQIFGFLGPNGAGKTTTILMLLGLTEPTSGEAEICGFNTTVEPLQVKRITGYLPENVGFYDDLTARENLRYITRLNQIPYSEATRKIDEALEAVGLSDAVNKEVGKFSKGMKQRLGIADVLVKDPKLVILDEPTTGIDPKGVSHILDLIVSLARDRGITVLLSSHLLHQVQKICDRVGIIVQGRMVAEGSIERLGKESVSGSQNTIEVEVDKMTPALIAALKDTALIESVAQTGNTITLRSNEDIRAHVSSTIIENGCLPLQIRTHDYGLEEIYMKYFREG
ncbi:MAG: ABC transporter ATP-binding protein [Chloroflexota bacterium]|nr:ABC transporter ATP-binding protein [Chloroflexota bacterium]